jgi:hypothetical protein
VFAISVRFRYIVCSGKKLPQALEEGQNMQTKDEIRNQIPHAFLVPCGDKYGTIRIEVIWVDDQNEVTVDGAVWGPSGKLVSTFTNCKIKANWIPAVMVTELAK